MLSKFKEWLIERTGDRIEQAVLGVVAGSDPMLTQDKKNHLLARSTAEFGEEIQTRLSSLGIIRGQDPGRFHDIQTAIKQGVKISELINMIRGPVIAPNAAIQ
jgi:hypothetical protein